MPNWCNNYITISGDDKEIDSLFKKAKSDESKFTLNNLVPIPKENEEDWYNWRIQNWGTKWDLGSIELEIGDGYASFSCETAWAPPNEALLRISKLFPSLSFEITYEEPGMDFCGKAVFQNGAVIEDKQASYNDNFNANLSLDIEKSTIIDDEIHVPASLWKKDDPYDFDAVPETYFGEIVFSDALEPDDFEESIQNGDIKFIFKNSQETVESLLNNDTYSISYDIENSFEEIKTTARYNKLNEHVVEDPNKKIKVKKKL